MGASARYAVFVLGAGASKEYGLPLGSELKQQISKSLLFEYGPSSRPTNGDLAIFDALAKTQPGYPQNAEGINAMLRAGEEIRAGLPQAPSIDQFLYNRSGQINLETVGKIAIARSIQIAENSSRLGQGHR